MILVIRANQPHCPPDIQKEPCDLSVSCSKETNFEVIRVPKPGCDPDLEMARASCSGEAEDGTLVKFFDPKYEKCVTDEDSSEPTQLYQQTERTSGAGGEYRITTKLDQPFNLGNDEVAIDFIIETLDVKDYHVKHIEIDGEDNDGKLAVLGELFIDRAIPSTQTPVKFRVPLDVPGKDATGTMTDLKMLFDVSFTDGTEQRTDRFDVQLQNLDFQWLRPTRKYDCPEESACDDKDPATRDYCDPTNPPFCKHEPVAGACGNGICESSENKCTCAQDCGQCIGSGEVIVNQCVSNQCQIRLRSDVIVEPIKTVSQDGAGGSRLSTTLEYPKPFNSDVDVLTVTIKMDEKDTDVSSFTIDSMQLLKDEVEIGIKPIGQSMSPGSVASTTFRIPTVFSEESMTPDVKVFITYTRDDQTNKDSYTVNTQDIVVYNP